MWIRCVLFIITSFIETLSLDCYFLHRYSFISCSGTYSGPTFKYLPNWIWNSQKFRYTSIQYHTISLHITVMHIIYKKRSFNTLLVSTLPSRILYFYRCLKSTPHQLLYGFNLIQVIFPSSQVVWLFIYVFAASSRAV